MNNKQFVSVSAINKYINYKFETDINLQEVYLQGEISNFKYSGKHCYFSLKDQFSEISAMFFYPLNMSLSFKPMDGMSVQVSGKIQIYQKKGTYAIIVNKMAETGVGLLYQEYLDLKEKLQKEGLFDESKKLPLPVYPEKVAVITAPTGEAIHDIISTFNRRFPLAKIKLYPALVQGVDAPKDLVRALLKVYQDNDTDAIIIGRGGGSFEDLSCFNDETLARTLFASKIPTVSAVGHEGDYTICDFVASFRAPTPTGAAMALSKDKKDVNELLIDRSSRLKIAIKSKLVSDYNLWNNLSSSYGLSNFEKILNNKHTMLDSFISKLQKFSPELLTKNVENKINESDLRMFNAINNKFNEYNALISNFDSRLKPNLVINKINKYDDLINQFSNKIFEVNINEIDKKETMLFNMTDKMVLLNPFNIMKKGYSIVYKEDNIVSSSKDLKSEDEIMIKMSDGDVFAKIK